MRVDDDDARPFTQCVDELGDTVARSLKPFCVKYKGDFVSMNTWYDEKGVSESVIVKRLHAGWTMIEAVNTPGNTWRHPKSETEKSSVTRSGRPAALYECDGRALTIRQWAEE